MELFQRQIRWGGARGSEAKSKAGRLRWGSEQQAPLTSSFLGTGALSFCFSLKSCLHSGLGPKVTEALCLPIVRAGGTNKGIASAGLWNVYYPKEKPVSCLTGNPAILS